MAHIKELKHSNNVWGVPVRVWRMHKIRINIFCVSLNPKRVQCRHSPHKRLDVYTIFRRKKKVRTHIERRNQRHLWRSDRVDGRMSDYMCSRRNRAFVIESFVVPFVAKKFVGKTNGTQSQYLPRQRVILFFMWLTQEASAIILPIFRDLFATIWKTGRLEMHSNRSEEKFNSHNVR